MDIYCYLMFSRLVIHEVSHGGITYALPEWTINYDADFYDVSRFVIDKSINQWHESIGVQVLNKFEASDLSLTLTLTEGAAIDPDEQWGELYEIYKSIRTKMVNTRLTGLLEISLVVFPNPANTSFYKAFRGIVKNEDFRISEGSRELSINAYSGYKKMALLKCDNVRDGYGWPVNVRVDDAIDLIFSSMWSSADYFVNINPEMMVDFYIFSIPDDHDEEFTVTGADHVKADETMANQNTYLLSNEGELKKIPFDGVGFGTATSLTTNTDEPLKFFDWEAQLLIEEYPEGSGSGSSYDGLVVYVPRALYEGGVFSYKTVLGQRYKYEVKRPGVMLGNDVLTRSLHTGFAGTGSPTFGAEIEYGIPADVHLQHDENLSFVAIDYVNNYIWMVIWKNETEAMEDNFYNLYYLSFLDGAGDVPVLSHRLVGKVTGMKYFASSDDVLVYSDKGLWSKTYGMIDKLGSDETAEIDVDKIGKYFMKMIAFVHGEDIYYVGITDDLRMFVVSEDFQTIDNVLNMEDMLTANQRYKFEDVFLSRSWVNVDGTYYPIILGNVVYYVGTTVRYRRNFYFCYNRYYSGKIQVLNLDDMNMAEALEECCLVGRAVISEDPEVVPRAGGYEAVFRFFITARDRILLGRPATPLDITETYVDDEWEHQVWEHHYKAGEFSFEGGTVREALLLDTAEGGSISASKLKHFNVYSFSSKLIRDRNYAKIVLKQMLEYFSVVRILHITKCKVEDETDNHRLMDKVLWWSDEECQLIAMNWDIMGDNLCVNIDMIDKPIIDENVPTDVIALPIPDIPEPDNDY